MMSKPQIAYFIERHNVQNTFTNAFTFLLNQHTCEDLDITDKNLSIDVEQLELELSDSNAVALKSTVYQYNNKIGYYKLVFTFDGKLVDEFFVIY